MSQAADALEVTRAVVRRYGRKVADLSYSGRVITVRVNGKAIGRLLPAGYTAGQPDDGSGLHDVWTAKHPSVPVPSDDELVCGLKMAEAVVFLLDHRGDDHG